MGQPLANFGRAKTSARCKFCHVLCVSRAGFEPRVTGGGTVIFVLESAGLPTIEGNPKFILQDQVYGLLQIVDAC